MFVKEKQIRFQHCDPAGIVFYPHYFVLFHELMEDWFNEGIGESYAGFVKQRGMGLPMVKVECEFLSPNSIGDTLALDLTVKRIGRQLDHARRAWPDAREGIAAGDAHRGARIAKESQAGARSG
jgi:acyl-CoA thioesterase FadM